MSRRKIDIESVFRDSGSRHRSNFVPEDLPSIPYPSFLLIQTLSATHGLDIRGDIS